MCLLLLRRGFQALVWLVSGGAAVRFGQRVALLQRAVPVEAVQKMRAVRELEEVLKKRWLPEDGQVLHTVLGAFAVF